MAAVVDVGALLVHHVIIFEQTLADAEVVLLHAFLGVLDCFCDHAALNHLPLFESEGVEHLHHAVGGEQTHQLILE